MSTIDHAIQTVFRLSLSLLLLVLCGGVSAQNTGFPWYAALGGTVRDSVVGGVPASTVVCALHPSRLETKRAPCGALGAGGSFRIDSLPQGVYVVHVQCRGSNMGRTLAVDTLELRADERVFWDRFVDGDGCGDPREVRREYRTMSGHYTWGMETSDFTPCPADGDERHIWAGRAEGSRHQDVEWPDQDDLPRTKFRTPIVFFRARGWFEGPGNYGAFGVSVFRFSVDSILEVRAPTPDDCFRTVR